MHMSLVEAFSQRVMIDKVFFVPNCVRLARLSHHLHRLLRQMWGAVPGPRVDDLSDKWGEELLSLERDKSSYLEKQSTRGKVPYNAPDVDKCDSIHTKMIELEPLLKASGQRNLRRFS